MWNDISNADFTWLGVALIIGIFSHLFRALRWKMLFEPLGYEASTKNTFYAVMVGYLVNLGIPRGGEVSRCALLNRTNKIPLTTLIGTVVTERVFDFITLLIILIVTFFSQVDFLSDFVDRNVFGRMENSPETAGSNLLLYLGIAALIGCVILFIIRKRLLKIPLVAKIAEFIKGLIEGALSIRKLKSPTLFIVYSLAIWTCYWLMGYITFFAYGDTHGLGLMAALTVLAVGSIGMVVPSPGGIGSYHYFVQMAMVELYGLTAESGLTFATILHTTQIALILVVGTISMLLAMAIERKNLLNDTPQPNNG